MFDERRDDDMTARKSKGRGMGVGKDMRGERVADALIDLDVCVLEALDLFTRRRPPRVRIPFRRPLVVGSGNAAITGRILFRGKDAVFANESDYTQWLQGIDGAVILSASGGKHAPIIARELQRRRIPAILLTNNPAAPAAPLVTKTHVFPKNPEPYTYNTSTYLGMILSWTHEDPARIRRFILRSIKPRIPDLSRFTAFTIIIPGSFEVERALFQTKFDELFGPRINGRIFTEEQMKHAKTIVPSTKECFLGIGVKSASWGAPGRRFDFPLPPQTGAAALMAVGYFIIGNIQKQRPPWFKRHLAAFTRKASAIFGERIEPIVR